MNDYAQRSTCGLVKEMSQTERNHRIPESFRAFCNMVSLTAANTRRIFDVSVACVRLSRVSNALAAAVTVLTVDTG